MGSSVRGVCRGVGSTSVVVRDFPLCFFNVPSRVGTLASEYLPCVLPCSKGITRSGRTSFRRLHSRTVRRGELLIVAAYNCIDTRPVCPTLVGRLSLVYNGNGCAVVGYPRNRLFVTRGTREREGTCLSSVARTNERFYRGHYLYSRAVGGVSGPVLSPGKFRTVAGTR